MNDRDPTCDLLLHYLDGTLSPEDRTDVERMLLRDAEARLTLRDMAEQAVVSADMDRVRRGTPKETKVKTLGDNPGRIQAEGMRLLALAAVAMVVVVLTQLLLRHEHERKIITITALSGPLEWTGDGGLVTQEFAVGRKLSGGTMELLAPDSWIEFEFQDRSKVTLMGQADVTISHQQQKELHLRHGRLSASVQPQPVNRPMLLYTPTAELKVLGTQFDVEAFPAATRLTVNEGHVRLVRLTDGAQVDVPAHQSVTASMDDQNFLSPRERGAPTSVWTSDLQTDVVYGKWISSLWMLGIKLKKAVANGEMGEDTAHVAYKEAATLDDETGSVLAVPSSHGSLVVLSVPRSAENPVIVGANGRVRVRGRMYSRVGLEIGLSTHQPRGGFSGKYSVQVTAEELAHDGDHFEIELPVNRFVEETRSSRSAVGNELVHWWCVADKSSVKIEITSVELTDNSK